MIPRRLRPGLLRGAISLVLTIALSSILSDAQTPKRGGTLRVSHGNEISNLDFYTAPGYELNWVAMTTDAAEAISNRGYHAHIYYDPETTRPIAERLCAIISDKFQVKLGGLRDAPG